MKEQAKQMLKERKGVLGGLQDLGLGIVVLVVLLAVGALILAEVDDNTTNQNATNIINDGLAGLEDLSGWIPIIVIAAVGALVIALIVVGFRRFGGDSGF